MAVRPILRLGHPTLREVAAPVRAFDTPQLHALIEDMLDTMRAADGAGLAAIQIGVLERVVVFGIDFNPRYPNAEPVPLTVLVNPEIEPVGTRLHQFGRSLQGALARDEALTTLFLVWFGIFEPF